MMRRAREMLSWPMLMLLVVVLLFGCTPRPAFRASPQLQSRVERIQRVAIISPQVRVYNLTAKGIRHERYDWSTLARDNLTRALDLHLAQNTTFTFTPFTSNPYSTILLENTGRYKAVSMNILKETYGRGTAAWRKMRTFDYTLGPQVERIAEQAGADALLFIEAEDHVSTAGRTAEIILLVLAMVAVGTAVAMATGGAAAPVIIPPAATTAQAPAVSVALVDGQTGDILWYNARGSVAGGDYNLRKARSCENLVRKLLRDFPGMP